MTLAVWTTDAGEESPVVVKDVRMYDLREGFLIITMRNREQIAYNSKYIMGFKVQKDQKEPEATDIE